MALNLPPFLPMLSGILHPDTGRAISFGSAEFCSAGTSTRKDVYSDRFGTTPAENPVVLDAAGAALVYLSGPYRIIVRDANGATVRTWDQMNSIAVETPAGNPGALIAANNLADLDDVAVARDVLQLTKQSSTYDADDGDVMLVGAFGLGKNAGVLQPPDTLAGVSGNKWYRVAAEHVTAVGGPSGAGDGVALTHRYGVDRASQVYYPVSGTNPSPWRRMQVLGTWSSWIRDYEYGSTVNGKWERYGSGEQIIRLSAATFTFIDADRLGYTWTFDKSFIALPHVSAVFSTGSADFINIDANDVGAFAQAPSGGTTSLALRIWRSVGADAFVAGNEARNVQLTAHGRWFA